RAHVVENPEGTPVGSDYQIIAVNSEVANGRYRQIQLQGLPVVPVVKGYVNSEFGSGKQQSFALGIFPDRAQKRRSGNPICDQLPGRAIVASAINVWSLIVEAAAVDGGIRNRWIKV